MQISNTQGIQSVFPQSTVSSTQEQISSLEQSKKTGSSTTNKTTTSPIHEVAQKYDVRNMSAPEMREMAKELYDNGIISGMEMGLLVLFPMEVFRNAAGDIINMRPSQSDTKLDFLENIKGALQFRKDRGLETKYYEKILSVLEGLDSARKDPVDLLV